MSAKTVDKSDVERKSEIKKSYGHGLRARTPSDSSSSHFQTSQSLKRQ